MKIFFDDEKLIIISSKKMRFDLHTKVIKSLKLEIKSIISCNES